MISRSQMRRQLRANGGIMNARQGYGLGSWVKEKIRKLIPNELANIAVKAAPFVSMIPGYGPAAAGIMRGVGKFDKTGSIGDSLKQGIGTYAGGRIFDAGMQGAGLRDAGASGYKEFLNQGTKDKIGGFFQGTKGQTATGSSKPSNLGDSGASMNQMSGSKNPTLNKPTNLKDMFQNKVSKFSSGLFEGVPILGELPPLVQQQILVGGATSAATYIYEAFIMEEPPQDENETMEEYRARRKENVGKKMRTYMDNYMAFDAEYSALDDAGKDAFVARYNANQGGLMRAGYAMGTPLPNDPTKPINPFGPKPTGPVLPSNDKMADARSQLLMQRIEELMDEGLDYNAARAQAEREVSSKNMGGLMRTGYANGSEEFQSYLKGRQKFEKEMSLEEYYKDFLRMKKDQRIAEEKTMAADGGLMRLNYMIGGEAKQMEAGAPPIIYEGNMDPNAQAGLPSVPGPMQMAEDGPEFDMREEGGFQPLGRQEGKDDVPAMLAKNEFVMTADAVRAAGGGSIQKGAQKMYDTMKKLESRVS